MVGPGGGVGGVGPGLVSVTGFNYYPAFFLPNPGVGTTSQSHLIRKLNIKSEAGSLLILLIPTPDTPDYLILLIILILIIVLLLSDTPYTLQC